MKSLRKPLAFALLALTTLSPLTLCAADEETYIELDLSNAEAGTTPPLVPFQTGVVGHSLDSLVATDANRIEVAANLPEFSGKSLHFIKSSSEPRSPRAVFASTHGLVTSGKVRFTWDAAIESFTTSDNFPGFEALMTFGLLDNVGAPFFNFYYLVGKDQTSGVFGCLGEKVGEWKAGNKQHFDLLLDFDSGTATILIDEKEVGVVKFKAPEALRVVQFSDGTGLAFYGSQYNAVISNFKMTRP